MRNTSLHPRRHDDKCANVSAVSRTSADDRGSSPPGSSRRAGGYSPVLRLTADEMSLPLFPCPKKFTFWDTTLLPRGTFWVRVPRRPARGRPKAVFLLLACCTQEEDLVTRASRSRAWGPAWVPGSPPAFRVVSRASASLGDRRSHRVFFDSSAARASSATRASISSISMALAPCVSTRSAARSFVDGEGNQNPSLTASGGG